MVALFVEMRKNEVIQIQSNSEPSVHKLYTHTK